MLACFSAKQTVVAMATIYFDRFLVFLFVLFFLLLLYDLLRIRWCKTQLLNSGDKHKLVYAI